MTAPAFVVLKHAPNPDIRSGGYWTEPKEGGRARRVPVTSLAHASREVRAYIERNGLGAGNCPGAYVIDSGGRRIARVSYNGKVFDCRPWQEAACLFNPYAEEGGAL